MDTDRDSDCLESQRIILNARGSRDMKTRSYNIAENQVNSV